MEIKRIDKLKLKKDDLKIKSSMQSRKNIQKKVKKTSLLQQINCRYKLHEKVRNSDPKSREENKRSGRLNVVILALNVVQDADKCSSIES